MRDCGLENFTLEVIERCETQAQANERERFRIRVLNCTVPNGYNQSNGGEGHVYIERHPRKAPVMKQLRERTRPVRDDELKLFADYFNVSADYLLGRNAPALSDEQATLLKGFDTLNAAGRNLLVSVSHAAKMPNRRVAAV